MTPDFPQNSTWKVSQAQGFDLPQAFDSSEQFSYLEL